MEAGYNGADRRLAYLFENANTVSFEPSLTAGTAVGTLTIDGEDTVLYAPTGGSASVAYTPIRTSGEAVGTLTIDETDYTVYAPNTAEDISYDPTDSGLTATDVQAAVDEVMSKLTYSSSASYTPDYAYNDDQIFTFTRYGNLVTMRGCNLSSSIPTRAFTTIFTITDSDFIPSETLYFNITDRVSGVIIRLRIITSGSVSVYVYADDTDTRRLVESITYAVPF